MEAAKVWVTERFIDAKSKTVRLRKNELVAIINDAKEKFDLDESVVVPMALVRKRAFRGNPPERP